MEGRGGRRGFEEGRRGCTRLTSLGARSGQAFPSQDGRRIAFVSNHEAGWQLWLLGEDGAEPRRLTSEADPVGWPSWSRDGGAIHFYGRRDGRFRLLRLDLETGAVARLDTLAWEAFRPVLHPAGELLLYDAVDPSTGGDHDIYVRHIATGRVRRLTEDGGYDSDARWSPDGRRIAFHSDRGARPLETQVYVMSSDGTDVRALTRGPALNGYPAWSPNGRCIVRGEVRYEKAGSPRGHVDSRPVPRQ